MLTHASDQMLRTQSAQHHPATIRFANNNARREGESRAKAREEIFGQPRAVIAPERHPAIPRNR
jgi:hypothetical protein